MTLNLRKEVFLDNTEGFKNPIRPLDPKIESNIPNKTFSNIILLRISITD